MMPRRFLLALAVACACNGTVSSTGNDAAAVAGDAGRARDAAITVDAQPAPADLAPGVCNGYEPCGLHPVALPAGYSLGSDLTVSNGNMNTTCTSFADCDMWFTHYTSSWVDSTGQPYDPYYNRMGSPFPWPLSRYVVVVPPRTITYAKLHVAAVGETYRYSDGTQEMQTARSTGATTCFQRGTGHLVSGQIGNLGGTGNVGVVSWNISLLPGDMGNSGNASTCAGNGGTTALPITSDENKAATTRDAQGKPVYCLLREGHDYYVNFMSSSGTGSVDCATSDCTMGGLGFNDGATTSDGTGLVVAVPCQ